MDNQPICVVGDAGFPHSQRALVHLAESDDDVPAFALQNVMPQGTTPLGFSDTPSSISRSS